MENELLHGDITSAIIKSFYQVYNELGYGFLERVYQNAMTIELGLMGKVFTGNYGIDVFYKGQRVGHFVADLVVEEVVIVEIKATESLSPAHEAQLINYLKATGIQVGILLNFGKKADFRRKIYSENKGVLLKK